MGRKKKRSWKVLSDYIEQSFLEDEEGVPGDLNAEEPTVDDAGAEAPAPAEPQYHAAHADEIPASFYDAEYFTAGTKSNYKPYTGGAWVRRLSRLILDQLRPSSVLEVGCAYGFVVAEMRRKGVEAYGFDVSEFAISQSQAPAYTWVGSADDKESFSPSGVDLIVSTEMLEHLSERQIRLFLDNAKIAKRMLLLFGIEGGSEMHEDDGHVTFQPKRWWERVFVEHGWSMGDASAFNNAPISQAMGWRGRFFLLSRNEDN